MPINGRYIAAALFILSGISARAGQAAPLILTTDDTPPLNFMNEQTHEVSGFVTDIIRKTMAKAGVDYKIELLPWTRAYKMALEESGTCVYSTGQTDDRMPLFKWVAPLTTNSWVLFGAPNSTLSIKSLDDVKQLKVGGYPGGKATYLESHGVTVDAAPRDELNIAKLLAGRIDLWATSEASGAELTKRQGVDNLKKLFVFKEVVIGLACNKDVSDETIIKLNTALKVVNSEK